MEQVQLRNAINRILHKILPFEISFNDINNLIGIYQCNAFMIMHNDAWIGSGIYPGVSMVNHSCRPNCTVVFDNNQDITLKSLTQIPTDVELTICYASAANKIDQRRKLEKMYFFECTCEECNAQENTHVT
jgi:SET and MYND domain-containing protein